MLRLAFLISLAANATAFEPCGDVNLEGIETMDAMLDGVPAFAKGAINTMCVHAARGAATKTTSECKFLSETLAAEASCATLGALLSVGSNPSDCWCKAAEDVAAYIGSQYSQEFAALAAESKRRAGGSARPYTVVFAGFVIIGAAAAVRRRRALTKDLL